MSEDQKEFEKLVAEDKRRREAEFMKIMNEAAQRLRVTATAIIESHGSTATARIVVKAD